MSNENQSWVYVVLGVVALLIVGIGVKQCGSSPHEDALNDDVEQRVAAIARRGNRDASADQDGGDGDSMAARSDGTRGGSGRDGRSASGGERATGMAGGGRDSGGTAQTVRDELRRGSQRAAAASGSGSIRVDSGTTLAGGGLANRDDALKEARNRVASRAQKNDPLGGAAASVPAADGIHDPAVVASETPVLSVLAKEENATTTADTTVHNNGATYEAGDGHVFDTESQVKIPNAGNINGEQGSIAFELKPKWEGADQTNASFFDLRTPNEWANRMELVKTGESLRFLMWDSEGKENGVAFQMKDWAPGDSHPIAVTWGVDETTGQKLMSLYVDGQLKGQTTYENNFDVPNNQPLVIGNNAGGEVGARSALNGFQVYNKVLDSGRISNLEFK